MSADALDAAERRAVELAQSAGRRTAGVTHFGLFKDGLSLPLFTLALAEFIGGSVFWSSAAWTPTALRTAKTCCRSDTRYEITP